MIFEIWKPVVGYDISNQGRLKSLSNGFNKTLINLVYNDNMNKVKRLSDIKPLSDEEIIKSIDDLEARLNETIKKVYECLDEIKAQEKDDD